MGNYDRGMNNGEYPILRLLSDYTPSEYNQANFLNVLLDINADVHFSLVKNNKNEKSVRIAMSGTRYSTEFLKACQAFYFALLKELQTTNRQDLININPYIKR
jgi:hypothetical protein